MGDFIYDDTWTLSLKTMVWTPLNCNIRPPGRSGMVSAMDVSRDRMIIVTGLAVEMSANILPESVFDITTPWVLDLDTDQWINMTGTTRPSRFQNPSIRPVGVYSAWGGSDLFGRPPTRLIVGGGWDNQGESVNQIISMDLDTFEWTILPQPRFTPFISSDGTTYSAQSLETTADDATDPFTALADAPLNSSYVGAPLRLLGGSASWVEKDGRTIYLAGGCAQDRTGREQFLYGNTEFISDPDNCIVRNPIVVNIPLFLDDELSTGTWSLMPERCMGSRKYSKMLSTVHHSEELIVFGGQGSLEWGDGLPGSIGVITKKSGEFKQYLPGLVSASSSMPMNREGQAFIPLLRDPNLNDTWHNLSGSAVMFGGFGENELLLTRLWVLRRQPVNPDTDTYMLSCSIRTAPVLALRSTFFTTRLLSLHGICFVIVFAVMIPIDVLLLMGLWSKRLDARKKYEIAKKTQARDVVKRYLSLYTKEWIGNHQLSHLLTGLITLFGTLFAIGAIMSGPGQWQNTHSYMGFAVILVVLFLMLSGLAMIFSHWDYSDGLDAFADAGDDNSTKALVPVGDTSQSIIVSSDGVTSSAEITPDAVSAYVDSNTLVQKQKTSMRTLSIPRQFLWPRSSVPWWHFRNLHIVFGYATYGLGIISIFLGIMQTLFTARMFYTYWIMIVVIFISATAFYRFFGKMIPGFTWIDRRLHHVVNEYQAYFQTVARKQDYGDQGNKAERSFVSSVVESDSFAVEMEKSSSAKKLDASVTSPPFIHQGPPSSSICSHRHANDILTKLAPRYSDPIPRDMLSARRGDADSSVASLEKQSTYRGKGGRFAPIQRILGYEDSQQQQSQQQHQQKKKKKQESVAVVKNAPIVEAASADITSSQRGENSSSSFVVFPIRREESVESVSNLAPVHWSNASRPDEPNEVHLRIVN